MTDQLNHRLATALALARVEIAEAADKMHVLGMNHPGGAGLPPGRLGTIHREEDKALMMELAKRFTGAETAISAILAGADISATFRFRWAADLRCYVGDLCVGAVARFGDNTYQAITSGNGPMPILHSVSSAKDAIESEASRMLVGILNGDATLASKPAQSPLERLEEERHRLNNSFGFGPVKDGQTRGRIERIDAEINRLRAAELSAVIIAVHDAPPASPN